MRKVAVGAASAAKAAPNGPRNEPMTRTGWITIAVPAELHDQMKALVPARAKSVSAYAQFWLRLGILIDRAMQDVPANGSLAKRVIEVLQVLEKGEPEN